jgi:Flp pilus assembly protein CpaB
MPDGRSRILLLLGLVLAVVTGVLLYEAVGSTARVSAVSAPPEGERTPVLVARTDIPAQTPITAEMLEARAFPAELVPAGAAAEPSALVGKRLAVAVPKGLPIVASQIAGATGPGGRPAIEPGRVLYSFATSDPLTAAGLVHPGDRVDLLGTVSAGSDRLTQTLVQDLEVIQVLSGRSLLLVVDRQTALTLKYLRDSGVSIDLVVRASSHETARTRAVNLGYVIQEYGIRP